MGDEIGCKVFELDGCTFFFVYINVNFLYDSIEHINQFTYELFSVAQSSVLQNFFHDLDELIQIYCFAWHHFKLLGNLQKFNGI
jgi:hypothetical protein